MSLATEIWDLIRTNLNQQIAAAKALFDDVQGERQELTTIRDSAVTARDEAQAAASDAANAARTEVARVVDGAPEDLDTIREVAEYAQSNRDITDQLNAAIGDKANKAHTHTTSQVTGLDTALDGKADVGHTHTTSQVTGLDTALARLSSIRAWFKGPGAPPASIPGAQVGDWWLDTTTMELHEITGV